MNTPYERLSEIEAVVQGFESCTTDRDDFTHAGHVTVALFYLYQFSESEATEKMRAGLLRFLNYHGIGKAKFHETLTVFWIKTLRAFLGQFNTQDDLLEITNSSLERFRNSRLVFDYYSKELLSSDNARSDWIEPDLKPLPNPTRDFYEAV